MSAAAQQQARALLPTATTKDTWRAVRVLCRSHRMLAVGAVLTLVAGTAAGLFVPPILGDLVNLVLAHRGPDAITEPVVLLIISAIAQALLTGLGYVLVSQLGETILATLRERVVRRAVGLPLEQIEQAGSGDLVARVSGDVSVVADAVRTALPALAAAALTIGLTIIGLAALDWRFAIAGLIATPIQFLALRWYLANSTPQFAAERIAEGARTQQLLDSVGGADTVRAFRLSSAHVSAVRARSRGALEYALGTNKMATKFFGRLNLAEFVGLTAILSVGFLLVRSGAVSVGATAAAALYFHRLFDPINTLLSLFGTAQEASAGLGRLVGIAEAPRAQPVTTQEHPQDATLRVAGVDFGYQQGHPVLHDISFEIAPGEHVALVGESGAGKTTLAKLIAGVHEPSSGSLTLGGVPISGLAEDRLRRAIALVTQEVHVFAGPLAADLRLARPEASDDQLRAALDKVGAATWADALPEGLATVVGESGRSLTATQGQQLALARLLLADPDIAVLDEATADAGSAGARQLDRAAAQALDERGALIVAHRLSQAITADRILVLAAGRIVESGSHQQLVAAGGRYAELWQAWSGARDTKSTVDS